MTLLHISDTHNKHKLLRNLPSADIIVHSGDFAFSGTEEEMRSFLAWFTALPYQYKILIGGNHDNILYEEGIGKLPENCFYLCHSGIEIEGLNFYGVPLFMEEIMLDIYDEKINDIPTNTDILITHQPPYSILDFDGSYHFGSKNLLQKVQEIQPKLHLFGHIHNANGIEKHGNTIFSNASIVDESYNFSHQARLLKI